MSEYVKYATSAADQYLATLSEVQDGFLKSLTPYAEMASSFPKAPAPAADFFPEMPTLAEVAEANFSFASKLLKQHKKFSEKLFAAMAPQESS